MRVASAVAAALALAWASGAEAKQHEAMFTKGEEVKWTPLDESKPDGVQVATVWGDMKKANVGFLIKVPAGFEFPRHSHTAGYDAVVIEGNFTHDYEGTAGKMTGGPGTFWHQAGKKVHSDKGEPGAECVLLVAYPHGKSDFIEAKGGMAQGGMKDGAMKGGGMKKGGAAKMKSDGAMKEGTAK